MRGGILFISGMYTLCVWCSIADANLSFSQTSGTTNHKLNMSYENIMIIQKKIEKDKIRRKICARLRSLGRNCSIGKTTTGMINSTPKVRGTIHDLRKVQSQKTDLTNDTSCMKFEIPNSIVNDSSINRAELYVHIKRRVKNKSKNRKRHRKHNKRVTLKVRQLSNTGKIGRVLASMQRKANKSKFYPIRLPIERLKKASANDLELCVSCIGCNKRTSLTLVQKVRKNGRRRKNKHRKPKRSILSRKRPYIKFS